MAIQDRRPRRPAVRGIANGDLHGLPRPESAALERLELTSRTQAQWDYRPEVAAPPPIGEAFSVVLQDLKDQWILDPESIY
jgi:hypothetical protein